VNEALAGLASFATLALIKAAPIAFAALGGVLCERSGVVDVALEGQLAAGAFTAVVVSAASGNPLLGLAAGIAAGALLGYALGLAATRFGADQIVAGIGLNVFALGACAFGLVLVFGREGTSDEVHALGNRGEAALILAGFGCAAALHALFYASPWGLRVRACAENPAAVRDAGLDPGRMRRLACTAGGALAGLGGVFLALAELDLYSDGMTAGRGFIALAAVIFGGWTPLGAAAASLVFGALSALQFGLQRSGIPSEAMQALPYLAALAALAGWTGRARAPQADGVPEERRFD